MVVNGVEMGELSVRDGLQTHSWGSQLGMLELEYVRALLLAWGRVTARRMPRRPSTEECYGALCFRRRGVKKTAEEDGV